MSTGGPNTQRFSPFTPPLRGSFPLDHDHICNPIVENYLKCLKEYNKSSNQSNTESETDSGGHNCRNFAKEYLECRMRAGLMTEEDLKSLGF